MAKDFKVDTVDFEVEEPVAVSRKSCSCGPAGIGRDLDCTEHGRNKSRNKK